MVDALGSEDPYTFDQPLIVENDLVGTRRPRRWLLRRRAHRADHARTGMSRERDRAHTNCASSPLYQNRPLGDVTPDMDRAVRRNTGNPKTCALFRRHILGKRRNMIEWHNSKLGRRAKRAIGLRAITPRSPPYPFRRYAITDQVDRTSAVTVRDDARIRHAQPE
jgi:hypothetical protein